MVTYKKLKYGGNDVIQVRSAQKDANGRQIDTAYVRHVEFDINTNDTTTNCVLDARIGTPRLVQIFDDSGNEVNADVVMTSTQVTVNLVGAPANKTWKGHVTAW